ncbi:hypothetical protein B0H94_107217 [Salsuginibacillus halophilus]|uniref:Membrane protein YufK n=1 Tax=Salsuginibacillus halophilus TaxID=517424 RepID=A0A2P8HG60_9BACI|nr:DUF5366 family protein [Salsuginibacillus halophilus]PSL45212.1 hypothetical protein B0H94_107217 [Salsuginibacillus halophilus]
MLRNTYVTSYVPLFSIILFSVALAIYAESLITEWLVDIGLYRGMMEFFSEAGITLTLLFLLFLLFFMVFSALKLIADTVLELSMLFFSKDEQGISLTKIRGGTWFYLAAGVISLLMISFPLGILFSFLGASCIYFIYTAYKVSDMLSGPGLVGFIFFHLLFWAAFILTVSYAALLLYNSVIASLPL